MYSLEYIKKRVESILLNKFGFIDIDTVKKFIDEMFIIDYEELLNQTIFEIYYENYNKHSERVALSNMFKNQTEKDNEGYVDLDSNKDYKKTQRTYKNFRKYNDNLSIMNNNGVDVEYVELENIKDRFTGHKIRKFHQNQLLDLNEFKIFEYIRDNRIKSSKSVSNIELVSALGEIDKVYDRINKTYDNYFERSVQYFQLENSCRLETGYLIANAISIVNKSLEEKSKDIDAFKAFFSVNCEGNRLQNKFILGIKKYTNKYIEDSRVIDSIPKEIYILNLSKYFVRQSILEELESKNICLDFYECNDFFKEYFGEMQHVNKNKSWDSKVLKSFRKIYKD